MREENFIDGVLAMARFVTGTHTKIDEAFDKLARDGKIDVTQSMALGSRLHESFNTAIEDMPSSLKVQNEQSKNVIRKSLKDKTWLQFEKDEEIRLGQKSAKQFIFEILNTVWNETMNPVIPQETQSQKYMKALKTADSNYPYQLPITAMAAVADTLNEGTKSDQPKPYWGLGSWGSVTTYGPLCDLEVDLGDNQVSGVRVEADRETSGRQCLTFKTYKSGIMDVPLEGPTETQIIKQFQVSLKDIKSREPRYAQDNKSKIGLTEMKQLCWKALAPLGVKKSAYTKPKNDNKP